MLFYVLYFSAYYSFGITYSLNLIQEELLIFFVVVLEIFIRWLEKKKYCENLASRFLLDNETDCPGRFKTNQKWHTHMQKAKKNNQKQTNNRGTLKHTTTKYWTKPNADRGEQELPSPREKGHGNEAKSISLSWSCVFLCDLRDYAK